MKNTQHKTVKNDGAKASPKMPSMLDVSPSGRAYGIGRLSAYQPITGCMTDETMFKVNAMMPSCVNVRLMERSKIGNIAGITACSESFSKWQIPMITKIEYTVVPGFWTGFSFNGAAIANRFSS